MTFLKENEEINLLSLLSTLLQHAQDTIRILQRSDTADWLRNPTPRVGPVVSDASIPGSAAEKLKQLSLEKLAKMKLTDKGT